jgi:beta-lactamase class C
MTMRLIALMVLLAAALPGAPAAAEADIEAQAIERIVTREMRAILPADRPGGGAVAVRIGGRTLFFSYGSADAAGTRPVTPDSLFALASVRKLFEATLLAQAIAQGTLRLDEPVARHVPELRAGSDIARITLGQLATQTSGLLLPQDHPPWPAEHYSLPDFIRTLNQWTTRKDHEPGTRHLYTHAGFVLLQLALERGLGAPIETLMMREIFAPLGMTSTVFPRWDESGRGRLAPDHRDRAVQGFSQDGKPAGAPGDDQGYYDWPGAGQIYSSARDMAAFLAAALEEFPAQAPLRDAIAVAQQKRFAITPRNSQALAWEIVHEGAVTIVEKNGGLGNASSYIGLIPERRLGVAILASRGDQYPAEVGRCIMLALARYRSEWTYQCVAGP